MRKEDDALGAGEGDDEEGEVHAAERAGEDREQDGHELDHGVSATADKRGDEAPFVASRRW